MLSALYRLLYLTVLLLCCWPVLLSAEQLRGMVIVNLPADVVISREQIRNIFLGKQKTFSNGELAKPLIHLDSPELSEQFNLKVINKNSRQIKAYWAKRVFTGKSAPPPGLSAVEIVDALQTEPGAISYVAADKLQQQHGLRILLDF